MISWSLAFTVARLAASITSFILISYPLVSLLFPIYFIDEFEIKNCSTKLMILFHFEEILEKAAEQQLWLQFVQSS